MKTNEAKSNNMPIFAARFAELRGERTQAEFAEFLGISRPTVGFYENGERIPDAFVLKQIAERCGVTADYLVGLSNVKTTDRDLQTINSITGLSEEAISALENLNSMEWEPDNASDKIRGCTRMSIVHMTNKIIENPKFTLSMLHIRRGIELLCASSIKPIENHALPELIEKYPEVLESGAEIVNRYEFADYLIHSSTALISQCVYDLIDNPIKEGANNADDPETR